MMERAGAVRDNLPGDHGAAMLGARCVGRPMYRSGLGLTLRRPLVPRRRELRVSAVAIAVPEMRNGSENAQAPGRVLRRKKYGRNREKGVPRIPHPFSISCKPVPEAITTRRM